MSEAAARQPQPTVLVIPAHNEAAVLDRCISTVLRDAAPDEFAVLVVSNGSTDGTAEQARRVGVELGRHIDVLEVPTASKIAALRAADDFLATSAAATSSAARIYLDADVVLPTSAARCIADALRVDQPRVAHVRIDVDTSASSWLVRQYYRAWLATGYIRRQDAGSGVFALNSAGVSRVGRLPDVINDDGYVARCFGADERVVCDVTFRSFAARSVWALVRRRARIVNGNRQLDELMPHSDAAPPAGVGQELLAAVKGRRLPLMSAAVFVVVTAAARALALWRRVAGSAGRWSTDTTTRSGPISVTTAGTTTAGTTTTGTTTTGTTTTGRTKSGTP